MEMMHHARGKGRVPLLTVAIALVFAVVVPAARSEVPVRFVRLDGFAAPGTPPELNKVGVLQIGRKNARNILILNPGTSASAAYFAPMAKTVVQQARGWAIWAVERRENLLEDHSVLNLAKEGMASPQEVFDYYLGWLANSAVTTHFQLIPDASVAYARDWGMQVEIEDLHVVVNLALKQAKRVVVGGHSLGGSITTAYATWDFDGRAGGADLAGLVYIDGGSGPNPISADSASAALLNLSTSSPWLAFGGIPAPFAGLFNSTGSLGAILDPNSPSLGQAFPFLPANLKPPVPVTNLAQYGYALDTKTSPPSLIAAQAHLGQLTATADPVTGLFGWDSTGAITPIQRFADMFSGYSLAKDDGLLSLDGTAWYHPLRLTIDSGAVAAGNANPAQEVLDVHATHGHDLPSTLRILAFGAALGGQGVLDAATLLANHSNIPLDNLSLLNRQPTYAHNDPAGAFPQNDFIDQLVPFLHTLRGTRVPRRS
jgi:pimeloyl-ACP methyl ester carboxylesterase